MSERAKDEAAPRETGTSTLDLALRVLELLATRGAEMPLMDIAKSFDASKATIYRHLVTLQRHGFVSQDSRTGYYAAGIKLLLLGEAVRGRFDVVARAKPRLVALRDETGQSATLCSLVDEKLIVLELVEGRSIIDFGTQPGRQFDFHASAHGRVWLAFGPHELTDRLMAETPRAWTSETMTSVATLRREVERARAQGWATAPNEMVPGVNALAAPVFNHRGTLIASVAIVGSIQRIETPPSSEMVDAVLTCANAISADYGWRP